MSRLARALAAARSHHLTGQVVRYGIVVASGYLLSIFFYAAELDLGIAPYLALGIAFVLNGLYNFWLIRLWAFPPSGRSVRSDLGRFCIATGLSFVVNYASFAILYSSVGLAATTAQRLAVLIAAPVTFLMNKLWSFRSSSRSPDTSGAEPQTTASAGLDRYSRS